MGGGRQRQTLNFWVLAALFCFHLYGGPVAIISWQWTSLSPSIVFTQTFCVRTLLIVNQWFCHLSSHYFVLVPSSLFCSNRKQHIWNHSGRCIAQSPVLATSFLLISFVSTQRTDIGLNSPTSLPCHCSLAQLLHTRWFELLQCRCPESMLTAHGSSHSDCRCLAGWAFMEPQFPLRLFSWALSSSLVCPWPGTDSVLAWEACCWQQSYLVVQGSRVAHMAWTASSKRCENLWIEYGNQRQTKVSWRRQYEFWSNI